MTLLGFTITLVAKMVMSLQHEDDLDLMAIIVTRPGGPFIISHHQFGLSILLHSKIGGFRYYLCLPCL